MNLAAPEGLSVLVALPINIAGDEPAVALIRGAALAVAATEYPGRPLTGQLIGRPERVPSDDPDWLRFECVVEVRP